MADFITKARYWMAICYPDRMVEDWQINISTLLQLPYCYIIHNKDLTKDGESRKVHVHILIAFPNTTTYKSALSVFKALQHPDKDSCIPNDEIRQVKSIRNVYNYFIHDTPECKKLGKHLYNSSERICGNLFDIGSFEQIGQAEREEMLNELTDYLIDKGICNFLLFVQDIRKNKDDIYLSIVRSYNGYFERLTRANYQLRQEERKEVAEILRHKNNVPCDE